MASLEDVAQAKSSLRSHAVLSPSATIEKARPIGCRPIRCPFELYENGISVR